MGVRQRRRIGRQPSDRGGRVRWREPDADRGPQAKREGWLGEIAGAYAQCPYISNRWLDYPEEFPSLRENDGYFISCQQAALLGSLYDPSGTHVNDVTCWAGQASAEDLAGLPPHVISVNELDPLRDEGLLYYRRLLAAGVPRSGGSWWAPATAGTCCFPLSCRTCSGRRCAISAALRGRWESSDSAVVKLTNQAVRLTDRTYRVTRSRPPGRRQLRRFTRSANHTAITVIAAMGPTRRATRAQPISRASRTGVQPTESSR